MKVKELMDRNIVKVNINTPLKEIAEKLLTENTGCVIVTNNNNDIAGIITFSDLFRFVFPDYNEIREHGEYFFDFLSIRQRLYEWEEILANSFMTKFPEVINKESSVIEAAAVMKAFKIKQLPVTENGNLVGLITSKNILKSFVLYNLNNISIIN